MAANLASGKGFADTFPQLSLHTTAYRPPLYPAFLAAFYAVFGVHPGLGRFLNVVLGTAVVGGTVVLVRRYVSPRAALVAGVAVACCPNLVANDTYTLNEPLALVILLAGLGALLGRRWAWAGVATGLLVLTRPSAQFVFVVAAVVLLRQLGWRRALGYVGVVALVVCPWIVRNWVQVGAPVLVTSNGYNWAAMYSPPAERIGAFVDPIYDPYFDGMRLEQFDERRWDAHLRRIGTDNLRRHPTLLAKVSGRNLAAFFEFKPSFNRIAEKLDGRDATVRDVTLPIFYLTLALGLAGLWSGRRNPLVVALAVAAAYFTLASMVFVAPPRLRAPVDLALCVGTGVIVDRVVGAWQARRASAASG